MSSTSLGRMVTLPIVVTWVVQIAVATVTAGNKHFTRLLQRRNDVAMLQLLAQHDTLITTRDSARLAAEAAQLATSAETPA